MAALAIMMAALLVAPPNAGPRPSWARLVRLAPPGPDEADVAELRNEAAELLAQERFAAAADVFARIYEREGEPEVLYAQAQALRLGNDCAAAVEVFARFIATEPPAEDAADARRWIEACRAAQTKEPPAEDEVRVPPPEPPTTPAAQERRPWYTDVAGGVLTGTGLLVTAAGAASYGVAANIARTSGPNEQDHVKQAGQIRTLTAVGITGLAVGLSLVVSGVVRYVVVAKRRRR